MSPADAPITVFRRHFSSPDPASGFYRSDSRYAGALTHDRQSLSASTTIEAGAIPRRLGSDSKLS
jgi:hypothetical protein